MLRYSSFTRGLLFVIVSMALLACSEDGYESRLRELILEDLKFDCGQSSQDLVFRHEDMSVYECESSEEWCRVSIDVPSHKLTVIVAANDTYDPRTAIITIADKNNAEKRAFNVSQDRNTGLFIGETSFEVPMEGGSVTVNLESNVNYEVVIPTDCDWVTMAEPAAKSRGLEQSSFTLVMKENRSYHGRDAIVKVVNKDEGLSGSVFIHQPFTTVFSVDSTAFEIPMDGGTFAIGVKSNIDYEVVMPSECKWITPSVTSHSSPVTSDSISIEFTVKENKGYDDREAVITLVNKEAGVSVALNVQQPFNAVFKADQKTFDVPMEGGTVTVNMESNVSYDVIIPEGCDWVTLPSAARTRGVQPSVVTLQVKENKSYHDRKVVVNIANKDAGVSIPITIQQPFNTVFTADKTAFDVDMAGGTVTVNLQTNISYDVRIPDDCDWITLAAASRSKSRAQNSKSKAQSSKSSAATTEAIVMRVKENPGYKDRDAVVIISNQDAGVEIKVSIHQPFTTVFKADKTAFDVDMAGGTITVNMESNVSYDVKIPDGCDWITMPTAARAASKSSKPKAQSSKTRGTTTSAVVFRVKENTSYKDREAVITISNKEAGVSVSIYIHQPFASDFKVDKNEFEVPMEGGTVTVNVESNIGYDVSIPSSCNWITRVNSSRTRGTQSSVVMLRVSENTSGSDRKAVVTIGNANAGVSASITITQPFTTVFKADKTAFDVDMDGGTVTVNMETNVSYEVSIPSSCDWISLPALAAAANPSIFTPRSSLTTTSAVVLRVKENTSYKDRDAVVTIANKEAGVSVSIYIHQTFATVFKVDKTDFEVPMKGGTVTAHVESNVSYDVKIPSGCNWITQVSSSRTRAAKTSVVMLRVSENTSGSDRSAVVTVGNAAAGVSSGITITQPFNTNFNVDATPLEVDELGGTLGVNVVANVSVDVKSQADWLKVGGKTGVGDGYWTQQIVVSPFTAKVAQRSGNVKFLYAAANQSVLVPVVQSRTLYISESEITLTEAGQTQALTLTNSQAATLKWSSSNTAVATVNSSGTVTAVANGKAVITVKSASNAKYTDQVNVIVNIPPPPPPEEDPDDNTGDDSGSGSGGNSGDDSGGNSGDNSGGNSGDNSGGNSGDNSGGNSGGNSGDNSGGNSGDNSGGNSGDNSGGNSGDNSGGSSGDNSGGNSGDNSGASSGDNPGGNPDGNQNANPDGNSRRLSKARVRVRR